MKIEKGSQGLGFPDKPTRPSEAAGASAFKAHLDKALVRNDTVNKPSPSVIATQMSGIVSSIAETPPDTRTVVQGLEDFLGTLAVYQERLGDAGCDLKMLERDLNRIDVHCRQMENWSRKAPIDDSLRGLLNEGLTTARVERERFYAGEYC